MFLLLKFNLARDVTVNQSIDWLEKKTFLRIIKLKVLPFLTLAFNS